MTEPKLVFNEKGFEKFYSDAGQVENDMMQAILEVRRSAKHRVQEMAAGIVHLLKGLYPDHNFKVRFGAIEPALYAQPRLVPGAPVSDDDDLENEWQCLTSSEVYWTICPDEEEVSDSTHNRVLKDLPAIICMFNRLQEIGEEVAVFMNGFNFDPLQTDDGPVIEVAE